jgi:hypothetical protein
VWPAAQYLREHWQLRVGGGVLFVLLAAYAMNNGVPFSTPLNNNDTIYAYASQLNSLTHLRALLVLHDRGILSHGTSGTSPLE